MHMDDIFGKISARSGDLHTLHKQHLKQLNGLANRLSDLELDANIHAHSNNVTLDELGNGEETYGFLCYSDGSFTICYRTTLEDLDDALNRNPEEPSYHITSLERASAVWIRAVVAAEVLKSLLNNLYGSLGVRHKTASESKQVLDSLLDPPLEEISQDLTEAAQALTFAKVVEDWSNAQAALHRDPAEAMTRASSMLETLFKHILDREGVGLPANKKVSTLWSAVRPTLCLDKNLVDQDIRNAINNLASTVGTLRTRAGSAHGRSPNQASLDDHQATFAVNCAGLVATFVMRKYLDIQNSRSKTSEQ